MKKIAFYLFCLLMLGQQQSFAIEKPTFIVNPYLQSATKNSIVVKWETALAAQGWVEYGKAEYDVKSAALPQKANGNKSASFQSVILEGLETETDYFYRAVSVSQQGDTLYSRIYPFKTAVNDDTPIAFAVLSDTQGKPNPTVWDKIAVLAEKERPNFAIHAGDQVDQGHHLSDWLGQFMPQGQSFMSKYPVFAVAGNHENDAPSFHKYLGSTPKARFYSFTYGKTQFFMLDTNHDVSVGSDSYNKLQAELAKSTATWKIVVHHHPIYSSDDDDYGNTRHAKSTLGSKKLSHLPALYDKHKVDIVFYGHIHTYERTWPLQNNKVDHANGTIYITIGGGGGGLENPASMRSWFTNKLNMDHHFGMVRVAGNELHFQAIDINGQVFDQFELKK